MIKDLEEAIYYCTIVEAMNKPKEHGFEEEKYYPIPMMYYDNGGDGRRRYYNGSGGGSSSNYNSGGSGSSNSGGSSSNSGSSGSSSGSSSFNSGCGGSSSQYSEREYPYDFKDMREGRSPRSRRMYMEAKETHSDKAIQMRELERYMQELTQDIVEMVEGASPEEKQYLNKRVSALATKLSQLND